MTKRKPHAEKPPAADEPDTTPAVAARTPAPAAPTRCRIVEYTDAEGRVSPAIVTDVIDENMHLCAFDAVFGPRNYCLNIADAARPQPGEPETWNWPARS